MSDRVSSLPPGLVPRMLSADQAAAYCGVSRPHFDTHIRPHLRAVDIGRRVLFDLRRIDEFLDRRSSTDLAALLPAASVGSDALAARLRSRQR